MAESWNELRGVPHLGDVMARRGIAAELVVRALTNPDRVVAAVEVASNTAFATSTNPSVAR